MSGPAYAGIGSRRTPPDVLATMRDIGHALALQGLTLRSGAAIGADTAFEDGAKRVAGKTEIYVPWRGYNGHPSTLSWVTDAARRLAATLHPNWQGLSSGARGMHARNCFQILGMNLDSPSAAVICWTPDGCEGEATRQRDSGGTATAIVLAERCGIPVFNLQRPEARERLLRWLA